MAEATRLRAMVFQHTDHFRRESGPTVPWRHLALLKDALLNRHYLENEVRLSLLTARGGPWRPAAAELRDPVRESQESYRKLERQRFATAGPDRRRRHVVPAVRRPARQLDHLEASLDAVRQDGAGDLVECGTGRGGGAIFMRAYLDAHEVPDTRVWVADRFRSSPEPEPSRRCLTGGWRASRPTSTWCVTASPGSTCSTTGCASSRARSRRC